MTERIGVYVCHCGTNIAGVVDVAGVAHSDAPALDSQAAHRDPAELLAELAGGEAAKPQKAQALAQIVAQFAFVLRQ